MKTSPNCTAVAAYFEDCVLKAYADPKTGGEPWTVGRGATGAGIGPTTVWTQAQADARFASDLVQRAADANNVIRTPVAQGIFDAFVDMLLNIGRGDPDRPGHKGRNGIVILRDGSPSTLLRLLNESDFIGARAQVALWISPGSSVELGLRRRRRADQALWDGLTGEQAIAIGAAIR